jgi:hypothetical protein
MGEVQSAALDGTARTIDFSAEAISGAAGTTSPVGGRVTAYPSKPRVAAAISSDTARPLLLLDGGTAEA